jgi:hypothetical protein
MKQHTSWWVQRAVKDIQQTYPVLSDKGYEFFSAELIDLGRQVTFRKQDLLVRIEEVRGEQEIYFRMGPPPPDEFTDIGSVIYAATGDKIRRSESSDPKVLAQYLDRIEAYFTGEYVKNKDSLRAAQDEYYAAFLQAGVVVPPESEIIPTESKKIPILHYPLIVIILLLIFGGVVTLCLVLVDRLFAAF